jgi:dolichyl-phosphate-mannose--protein O-mannosyl transferase
MSEWYEWPTMDMRLIPFGRVGSKGRIYSVGNPAVWWGVTGVIATSLLVGVFIALYKVGLMFEFFISFFFFADHLI